MVDGHFEDMDVEYAATIAEGAIQAMAKQSVPPTPNNFSVWFNYAIGASPALRKTIDILVGGKRKFNASINQDLYFTYINPRSDCTLPGNIAEQLQGVITNAKQFLATAIAENRAQIDVLGDVRSDFQTSSDPRPIMERLVLNLLQRRNERLR